MPRAKGAGHGFVGGLVASAAASLVMLLARVILGVPAIPELLLDAVSALTPLSLFSLILDALKYLAKPLLMAALVAGQLLAGGALGAAYGRLWPGPGPRVGAARWRLALLLAGGLWLLTMLVLLPALGAGRFGSELPVGGLAAPASLLVASLVYGLTLAFVDEWLDPEADPAEKGFSAERRALLRTLGWGALALGAGYFVVRGVGSVVVGAQAGRRSRGDGTTLPPEVTPTADFYVVSKNAVDPEVDLSQWRLQIEGMVSRPLTLTYDELRALPAVEQHVTLECISNEVGGDLIGNALWKGVRLRDLLERAGPLPGVRKVWLTGADGYDDTIAFDRAMSPANVLAYDMNGAPLEPGHGFPARLLVPGIYGMKNVKWLTRIQLVDWDYKGFWQQRGWSDEASIKTMSRIDLPIGDAQLPAGLIRVGGVAFSGDRGIGQVELSVDDGETWQRAVVKQALSPYTWVLWSLDWTAPKGKHRLLVRATDARGQVQEAREAPPAPDGASGYHQIVVNVVEA